MAWGGYRAGTESKLARFSIRRLVIAFLPAVQLLSQTPTPAAPIAAAAWSYGGFVDLGYSFDFNHPGNRQFRNRSTSSHTDEIELNIAGAYLKKKATDKSRWGMELELQAGNDTDLFGFSSSSPNLPGYRVFRHLGLANATYVAPVGSGLTIQAGIFGSLIGYDGLYAKDNLSYTRPWGGDLTPYLMTGISANYAFTPRFSVSVFETTGYAHLSNANGVPSSGGQLAYKVSPAYTLKQTLFTGPHQSNTDLRYWRLLSDSILERKSDRATVALEYVYSREHVNSAGNPEAILMASQLPVHVALDQRWSVTVRPELLWDRDGRWSGSKQTIKAVTSTLEYKLPIKQASAIFRLEHRYDDSRGAGGGFYRGAEINPTGVGLTPTQHLLIGGLILTFDH